MDTWNEAKQLFLQATKLPPDEREGFLRRNCSSKELLPQLLALVKADESDSLDLSLPQDPSSQAAPRPQTATFVGPPTPPPPRFEAGDNLGRYHIAGELGRGGMGIVYLAQDTRLDRRVALKSLLVSRTTDQKELYREAKSLAALNHENIATIYNLEELSGQLFLVLEYLDGVTLHDLIQGDRLPYARTHALLKQLIRALHYAHSNNVVHRDLKPTNVMVVASERLKILDFGLARILDPTADAMHLTATGFISGTPSYMSPEQVSGEAPQLTTDLWALACIAFECLTGQPAFEGGTLLELFARITEVDVRWEALAAAPHVLTDLVRSGFVRDPAERQQSFRKAAAAILDETLEVATGTGDCHAGLFPVQRKVRQGNVAQLRVVLSNSTDRTLDIRWRLTAVEGWIGTPEPHFVSIAPRQVYRKLVTLVAGRAGELDYPVLETSSPSGGESTVAPPTSRSSISVLRRTRPGTIPRTQCVEALLPHVVDPASNPGGTVDLVAPPGFGKSLLLRECVEVIRRNNVRVLELSARGSERLQYRVLHDFLRRLLGLVETEHDESSLRRYAEDRLGELLGPRTAATDYFVQILTGEAPTPPDARRDEYRWYRLLCAAVVEAPIVLALDDASECDDESAQILRSLLQRSREDEIAFCVLRTFDDLSADRGASSEQGTTVLQVPPLSADEIDLLIEETYPNASAKDDFPRLAALLLDRCGGHPALLCDLVHELGGDEPSVSIFERRDNRYRTKPDADYESIVASLPVHYEDSIAQRVALLPEPARETLESAALLGVEFPVAVLEELEPNAEQLDESLDALEQAGFLQARNDELTRYAFSSHLMRDCVRAELESRGSRRAARVRGQVMEALVSTHGNSPENAEWLARALTEAGQSKLAQPYLLESIELRLQMRSYEGARALAHRMERSLDQSTLAPSDRLRWELARARLAAGLGQKQPALTVAEGALELSLQLKETAHEQQCRLLISQLLIESERFPDAEAHIKQVLAAATSEDPETSINARNNLAIAKHRQGLANEAAELLRENLSTYESLGDASGESKTLTNLGSVMYAQGQLAEAALRFEAALAKAREIDNPDYEAINRSWVASIAQLRGNFEEAKEGYLEVIDIIRRVQNRQALAKNYFNLAQTHLLLGELDQAVTVFESAVEQLSETGQTELRAQAQLDLASVQIQLGRQAEACALWTAIIETAAHPVTTRLAQLRMSPGSRPHLEGTDPPDLALAMERLGLELASGEATLPQAETQLDKLLFHEAPPDSWRARCDLVVRAVHTHWNSPYVQAAVERVRGEAQEIPLSAPLERVFDAVIAHASPGQESELVRERDAWIQRRASRILDPQVKAEYLAFTSRH